MGALDSPDFWRNEADWMLDLEQTHTAFPILSYFPETHTDHSWVATVGSLLDAAALVASASETEAGEVFEDVEKGPLMVLVYGLPLIVRIARRGQHPAAPADEAPRAHRHFGEPAPPTQHRPGRVPRGHGGPGARPGRSILAARRRRGAASPGSAPPTTPRCGRWRG